MNWYYKFLVHHPFLIILGISVLALACIIVSGFQEFPDFSNPTVGFEARGTDIGKRLTAWHNLLQETGGSGKLVADPNDLITAINDMNPIFRQYRKKGKKKRKNKNLKKNMTRLPDYGKNDEQLEGKTIEDLQQSNLVNEIHFRDYEITNDSSTEQLTEEFQFGKNKSYIDDEDFLQIKLKTKKKWKSLRNKKPPLNSREINSDNNVGGYFCESPNKDFSHFVIESNTDSEVNLFNLNVLLSICQLESQIIQTKGYKKLCQKENYSEECCKLWSLPNYVALLNNKTNCFDIDHEDVTQVETLLLNCYEFYHEFKLGSDCSEDKCRAPIECTRHNAVFDIMHYLTDINFIKLNSSRIFLQYSILFIPVAQSSLVLPFYHDIEKTNLQTSLVRVVAMNFGLKNALFDECLISDGWLIALGGIFVMSCIWLYTSSVFVTLMTVVSVLFSLGLSYFVYTLIFELKFFPFMNLLAVVVCIGIGADDAFIFTKIWQCELSDRVSQQKNNISPQTDNSMAVGDNNLVRLMGVTFRHAALSMFVTTITTSLAFYASAFSSITSVKCFGIFSGTTILINYMLMITWLPASISIMERLTCQMDKCCSKKILNKLCRSINNLGRLFEKLILKAIINVYLIWIIVFGTIGISSCLIVFYCTLFTELYLPNTEEFQLFVSDHPFQLYETKFKDLFWFERISPSFSTTDNNFKIPLQLRFIWGILPVDDGDYFNPYSRGELHFDNNFNLSATESQEWLLKFCKNMKKQNFYQFSTFGFLVPNCFIENFISWMNRKCIDSMDNVDRTPCCEVSKFPYKPEIFELCLPLSISSLYATPREFFIPGVAGPKFATISKNNTANIYEKNNITISSDIYNSSSKISYNIENNNFNNKTLLNENQRKFQLPPKIKALVVEFDSNFSYSLSYSVVEKFLKIAQTWFDNEIKTAPVGMQNGWFISELEFFDLQDTLSKGTLFAIYITMGASLIILLISTQNLLISLLAVVTLCFTIFTTIAILILIGWKLNILESVAVSTAVGLAVDFSLHYGISYKLSPNKDRLSSTMFALSRIVGPTMFAALTTAFAGTIMLFSKVLPYVQIGLFLLIVMTVSWLYATLFFLSLLYLIGPENDFLQVNFSIKKYFSKNNLESSKRFKERSQSQIVAVEQLLTPSSSAIGELINSESHELDSLTNSINSNSLIKHACIEYEKTFNNKKQTNMKEYRSPSSGSAVTVVDDNDKLQ